MQLDDIAAFNRERWNALVEAGIEYSRPFLDLNEEAARAEVDRYGFLGDVTGKEVLCLASGGGQQSACLAFLGAKVTVFDLSDAQLANDRRAAAHYGFSIRTIQGDMRDLSCFDDDSFDIVWHAYSINFVPDARRVLHEAARVARVGAFYRIQFANPFLAGMEETDWTGDGYALRQPYVDGAELLFPDPHWDVYNEDGSHKRVIGPHEYRHSLSTMINTLAQQGFIILGTWEQPKGDIEAKAGSWEHFKAVAPPWLTLWARYRPDVLGEMRCSSSINW